MDDKGLGLWLNIGSLILILPLTRTAGKLGEMAQSTIRRCGDVAQLDRAVAS